MRRSRVKKDISFAQKATRALVYGFVVALAVCVVMLTVFALILANKDLPLSVVWMFSTVTLLVSSFVGGFTAERLYRSRGIMMGAIIGLLIFAALMVVNSLMGGQINWSVCVTKLLTGVIAGVIGGIIGLNTKIGRKSLS